MIAWVMVSGMLTVVNVTMVGAIMQLAGSIPDGSLLVIISRYLRRKGEPASELLLPAEAFSRLRRLRSRAGILALISCVPGLSFTIWASTIGWGLVAGLALTFWVMAANLGFLTLPLASLARRARRMRPGEEREGGPDEEGSGRPASPGSPGDTASER